MIEINALATIDRIELANTANAPNVLHYRLTIATGEIRTFPEPGGYHYNPYREMTVLKQLTAIAKSYGLDFDDNIIIANQVATIAHILDGKLIGLWDYTCDVDVEPELLPLIDPETGLPTSVRTNDML